MKKTINVFITIVLFISMILYGKAQTITVEDLVKRINEVGAEIKDQDGNVIGNTKDDCIFVYENQKITITCNSIIEETNETIKSELNIAYNNSVLIYDGDYKLNDQVVEKNSLDYLGKLMSEVITFGTILENLAILKGYSLEDIKKLDNDQELTEKLKKMSLDEIFNNYGFYYDGETDASPIFKVDINRFKLPDEAMGETTNAITPKNLSESIKTRPSKSLSNNAFFNIEDCSSTYNSDELIITCSFKEKEYSVKYKIKENILSYISPYTENEINDENVDEVAMQAFTLGIVVEHIGYLLGKTYDEIKEHAIPIIVSNDETKLANEYGIEIITKTYTNSSNEQDGSHLLTINYVYSLTFDLTKFVKVYEARELITETPTVEESKNDIKEDSSSSAEKNPHTSAGTSQILIGGLFILIIGVIAKIKKKNFFESI